MYIDKMYVSDSIIQEERNESTLLEDSYTVHKVV